MIDSGGNFEGNKILSTIRRRLKERRFLQLEFKREENFRWAAALVDSVFQSDRNEYLYFRFILFVFAYVIGILSSDRLIHFP